MQSFGSSSQVHDRRPAPMRAILVSSSSPASGSSQPAGVTLLIRRRSPALRTSSSYHVSTSTGRSIPLRAGQDPAPTRAGGCRDLTLAVDLVVVEQPLRRADHRRAATVVRLDHEGRPDAAHGGTGGTLLLPDGLASTGGPASPLLPTARSSSRRSATLTVQRPRIAGPGVLRPRRCPGPGGGRPPGARGRRARRPGTGRVHLRGLHRGGHDRGGLIQARGFAVRLTMGGAIDPDFGEGGTAPVGRRADQDEVLSQVIAEPDGRAGRDRRHGPGRPGVAHAAERGARRHLRRGRIGARLRGPARRGDPHRRGATCRRRLRRGRGHRPSGDPSGVPRRLDEGGALAEGFANGPTSVPALPPTAADDQAWQPRIAIDGHGALLVSSGDRVVRFDAGGRRDLAFAGDGTRAARRLARLGSRHDRSRVRGGRGDDAEQTGRANQASLRGYAADGTPDDTFGAGGHVTLDLSPSTIDAAATHRAVVVDGDLYASGIVHGGAFVVRLDQLGVLDPSYGTGGVARGGSAERATPSTCSSPRTERSSGCPAGRCWVGATGARRDARRPLYVETLWQSTNRDDVATGEVIDKGLLRAVSRSTRQFVPSRTSACAGSSTLDRPRRSASTTPAWSRGLTQYGAPPRTGAPQRPAGPRDRLGQRDGVSTPRTTTSASTAPATTILTFPPGLRAGRRRSGARRRRPARGRRAHPVLDGQPEHCVLGNNTAYGASSTTTT